MYMNSCNVHVQDYQIWLYLSTRSLQYFMYVGMEHNNQQPHFKHSLTMSHLKGALLIASQP